jgi:hypothetical protein
MASMGILSLLGRWELFFALIAALLFVAWRSVKRRVSWTDPSRLTPPLNVFATAWCGIALVTAVVATIPQPMVASERMSIGQGPNVYLILLDAYPRHDTLMSYFEHDNEPFLNALRDRGFDVAEESESGYVSTILTVPSILHVRRVEELLAEPWEGSDAQHRLLWQHLNAAPIPQAYEAAGYTTYSIISGAPALDWRTADIVLDNRWLTFFESHLIERGVLGWIFPDRSLHHASYRASVLDAFDYLESSAGTSKRFVLAHILSPHDPYAFAPDGSPAAPCDSPLCTNHVGPPNPTLADRFTGQLQFLNGRILEAVDHIIEADPDGVVIVFSDHGLRRDPDDLPEWTRTLFAARNATYPDDVTTIDIFPGLPEWHASSDESTQ